MPLYEYACCDCRREFELLVRSSDRPSCPHCDSPRLDKLLSVAAAHSHSVELPSCPPLPSGGCGRPECGQGGCGMG